MSSSWFAAIVAKMKPKKRRQIETDPIALKFNWVHAGPMTPMIILHPLIFSPSRRRMDSDIKNIMGGLIEFHVTININRGAILPGITRSIKNDLLIRVGSAPRLNWWKE